MLDGRFNLNFSPLGIILNLLSTRSFSDSVDELGDHLDVKYKDEEGDLFLFLAFTLTSFLYFCWSVLSLSNSFSSSLTYFIYRAYFLKKFLGFPTPILLTDYVIYLQIHCFLPCLITGVNCRGNNIRIMLICIYRFRIFQTL